MIRKPSLNPKQKGKNDMTPHEHAPTHAHQGHETPPPTTKNEHDGKEKDEKNLFAFSNAIQQAVKELGYDEWTPIQRMSIPLILANKDVIGQSHTGSGKTAAFGLPIIENIRTSGRPQVLILVPTRELCEQVMQEMRKFARHKRVSITAVYGGVGMGGQIANLRRTDIVVGTPGRILDHMGRGTFNASTINVLVLDEADRMLDMGFIRDMKKIMMKIPTERQTLLFSATLSGEVHQIAQQFMKHPHVVKAEAYVDKGKLEQIYYDLDKKGDQKFGLLLHILKEEKPPLAIIFAGTRRMVDKVERNLNQNNVHAQSIHGGLSQNQRKRTLDDFHRGHFHVLVASDVAARGLDIKNVSHIINYDIPRTASEYIHRSGRTARAGEEGKIISLLAPQDYDYFRGVLRDKSIPITETPLPAFESVLFGNTKGKPEYSEGKGPGHARPMGGRNHSHPRGGDGYSTQGGKRFFPRKSEIEGKPYGNRRFGDSKPFGSRPASGGTSFAQSGTRSRDERPTRDPNWKGKKPFIKGKRYPQDENIKVTKHFGLKHAPKDE